MKSFQIVHESYSQYFVWSNMDELPIFSLTLNTKINDSLVTCECNIL